MGSVRARGIDEMIGRLESLSTAMEQKAATEAILHAGAKVVIEEWQNSIEKHGHVVTHDLQNSITEVSFQPDIGGGVVRIGADGYDSKGKPNPVKAYTLNTTKAIKGGRYGRHGKPDKRFTGRSGSNFVKQAEQKARQRTTAAMQKALDDFVQRG